MRIAHKFKYEAQLSAEYTHVTWMLGASQFVPTGVIVAAGRNAAILHYGENNSLLPKNPMDLVLVDAGISLHGYISDVTRTWPVGGVFSGDYKLVYEAVLDGHTRVCKAIKPGVEWEDMHRLANDVIVWHLVRRLGVMYGSLEEMKGKHVGGIFFPHGLGHLIGLEGHDVGGYPEGVKPIDEPGLKNLRMRRKLEVGMVVTVEPGLYFNSNMLANAMGDPEVSKFFDLERMKELEARVGGVRIEDMVLVTENGCEILSDSAPREIGEIEELMRDARGEGWWSWLGNVVQEYSCGPKKNRWERL
ncbi:UNVERIFIED_CONTAM: hypothetical protein HDU68_007517 [Siphonaria sp. JEL0065]|nr:hypothetical protein HDU68_007517 [Siphonaria sp. JEL0065]